MAYGISEFPKGYMFESDLGEMVRKYLRLLKEFKDLRKTYEEFEERFGTVTGELTQQMEDLEDKVEQQLLDTIDQLHTFVESNNEELKGYVHDEVNTLTADMADTIAELNRVLDQTTATLRQENTALQNTLNSQINTLNKNVSDTIDQLNNSVNTAIATLQADVTKQLTDNINSVNHAIDDFSKSVNQIQQTMQAQLESQKNAVDAALAANQIAVDKQLDDQAKWVSQEIEEIHDTLHNLDIDAADSLINTHSREISTLQQNVVTLTQTDKNLEDNIAAIRAEQGVQNSAIEDLQTLTAGHTSDISNNAANIMSLNSMVIQNTSNIGTLVSDVSKIKTEQTTQNNNIVAIQTEQSTQNSNISANSSRIGVLEQSDNAHTSRIERLEKEAANDSSRIASLEGDNVTNKNNITTLENQLSSQDSEISGLDTRLSANEDSIDTLQNNDLWAFPYIDFYNKHKSIRDIRLFILRIGPHTSWSTANFAANFEESDLPARQWIRHFNIIAQRFEVDDAIRLVVSNNNDFIRTYTLQVEIERSPLVPGESNITGTGFIPLFNLFGRELFPDATPSLNGWNSLNRCGTALVRPGDETGYNDDDCIACEWASAGRYGQHQSIGLVIQNTLNLTEYSRFEITLSEVPFYFK